MANSTRGPLTKTVTVAAIVLGLTAGGYGVASAASGSSSTTSTNTGGAATAPAPIPSGATAGNPWGNQRRDETLLTGDTLSKVQAAAVAKAGSGATIVRVETDSDASVVGHAAYEAHVVKADGTAITVYVDKSFNVVSVETQPSGGPAGGHGPASTSTGTSSTTTM